MRRWLLLLVVLASVAGGCSNASDGDEAASSDAGTPAGGGDTAAQAGGGEEVADAVAAVPVGVPLAAGRSIIATATASVHVDDVEVAARRAVELAAAVGGFLAGQEAQLEDREVRVTLRVPSTQFHQVLGDVSDLGEVVEADVATQDVTEVVVDLESRISSARVSVERLRDLLGRAGDVAQLAAVEGELARREAELESLLGRLRVVEDQVDLSTIDVRFTESSPTSSDLPGFLHALGTGWGAFSATVQVGLAGVGYALPFAAFALVTALGFAAVRRHHGRPAGTPPLPEA